MDLMNRRWSRGLFFTTTFLCLISVFFYADESLYRIFILPLMLYAMYNSYLELVVAKIFISPNNSKPSIEGGIWQSHSPQFKSLNSHILTTNTNGVDAPIVIFIHGWRSTSLSVVDRAEWFVEKGWNAVIIELLGHGKSSPIDRWNAISAVEHVEHHLNRLETFIDISHSPDLFVYGHSMGGFIASRITSSNSKVNNLQWTGTILESPLMMYSEIYEEIVDTLHVPNIVRKSLLRRVYREVLQMHPEIKVEDTLEQFNIPQWGLPRVPTLCLQASNDNRLGRMHYDVLHQHAEHSRTTFHLIETLTHSGAKRNAERESLLLEWLSEFESLLLK